MKFTVDTKNEYTLFSIEGSLTIENLINIESRIKDEIELNRHILLNLEKLSYIDSSSIRFIIHYYTDAKKRNLNFCIAEINKEIEEVFSITEIDKMIPLFRTKQEAVDFILQG